MDAERYGRGRVPRGRSLTSGCRAVWERACTEGAESNQRMQDVWEGACTEGAESYLRMRGGLGGGVSHFSSSEFGPGFSGLPSSCSVCVCVSEQRQTKHVNAKHWNFSITNR